MRLHKNISNQNHNQCLLQHVSVVQVLTQFHSKKQRKMVMRLVKQHTMNMKYANRQMQSTKGKMSYDEMSKHIDKTEPYPKNMAKTKMDSKHLSEQDQEIFMQKAFFKGDKGTVIPKLYHSSTDKEGKKWYQSSALETRKHMVKGQGDFHSKITFNTPYKLTKKDKINIIHKLNNKGKIEK